MPKMNMQGNTFLTDLTGAIQMIPNQYGYVNSLNLFDRKGITGTSITVDRVDNETTLLDSVTRTSRGIEYNNDQIVQQYAFPIPYFRDFERIIPEELQGVRAAGTMDTVKFDQVRTRKLANLKLRHDMTQEFMKMQALKGKVMDANGRVFADMYATYGFDKKVINFNLDVDSTNVSAKIREVVRYIEDNAALGGSVNGEQIIILVDQVFFDKLVSHPTIKEAYMFYQSTQDPLRSSFKDAGSNLNKFTHAGVTFVEYRAQFKDKRGNMHKLVGSEGKVEGVGHVFPNMGALNASVYQSFSAPANKIDYVNTVGEELYTFEWELDRGEGFEYEYISSNLHLMMRPNMLLEIQATGK